jgi:hypothetical protein
MRTAFFRESVAGENRCKHLMNPSLSKGLNAALLPIGPFGENRYIT